MNETIFKSEAACWLLVLLPASPFRKMPGAPALISFNTRKGEVFSLETSLVQACHIAFYQEHANKIAEHATGSQTGNTNVSYHGVFVLFCFSDKCCLVANAWTGSLQLLCLVLILTMP